ncbi:MAG: hypothetical protein [Malazfec virus 1]
MTALTPSSQELNKISISQTCFSELIPSQIKGSSSFVFLMIAGELIN